MSSEIILLEFNTSDQDAIEQEIENLGIPFVRIHSARCTEKFGNGFRAVSVPQEDTEDLIARLNEEAGINFNGMLKETKRLFNRLSARKQWSNPARLSVYERVIHDLTGVFSIHTSQDGEKKRRPFFQINIDVLQGSNIAVLKAEIAAALKLPVSEIYRGGLTSAH